MLDLCQQKSFASERAGIITQDFTKKCRQSLISTYSFMYLIGIHIPTFCVEMGKVKTKPECVFANPRKFLLDLTKLIWGFFKELIYNPYFETFFTHSALQHYFIWILNHLPITYHKTRACADRKKMSDQNLMSIWSTADDHSHPHQRSVLLWYFWPKNIITKNH